MFIFAVLGHYLFGTDDDKPESREDWGTLGASMMTLWIYVCADGWTPYQFTLDKEGFAGSQIYTAAFIFVANFIISNLFIGVICQNIGEATEADRRAQRKKREEGRYQKREMFLQKQRQNISQLVAQRTETNGDFQSLLHELAGTLRHEDVVPMTQLTCNLTWLETFMVTLHYHENTMYRCQQTHFAIANTLAELVRSMTAQEMATR
ncbi:Cation channel sperm-associated protein 3 [Quaeritorhiza haematococci]|nr:Cation channel sperm-associated protein 3 [Quaeritorhiza haematococci]